MTMTSEQQEQVGYRPVEVDVAGKTYTLRLTMGAARKIREHTGGRVNLLTGFRGIANEDFPVIVWACLSHKGEGGDPSLTLDDFEDMVELDAVRAMTDAVLEMFGVDMRKAEQMGEDVLRQQQEAAQEQAGPLGSPTDSSSSGPKPVRSSDSPAPNSGNSRPGNTPRSETPEKEPSDEPTIAPV